jgi:ribonuclease R
MARCNQGRAFSRRVSALSMKKSKPKQKNSSTPNGPDWRDRDQQAEVEAQRYAEPIPSRALLLQILAEQPGPLTVDELIGQLGLRRLSEQEALAKRLAAMVREGQLAQNRR